MFGLYQLLQLHRKYHLAYEPVFVPARYVPVLCGNRLPCPDSVSVLRHRQYSKTPDTITIYQLGFNFNNSIFFRSRSYPECMFCPPLLGLIFKAQFISKSFFSSSHSTQCILPLSKLHIPTQNPAYYACVSPGFVRSQTVPPMDS